jgi:CubicO group peptidase (beta-lactamase class C family)
VTKVFTALVLANMAVRGEVGLDDAVASLLPGIDGHGITLRHLATHTTGLPSMLPGFAAAHARGAPDFTTDDLLAEFVHWAPPRAPGERFEYSNNGYAILGTALCRMASLPFEALIHTRICQPLRMSDASAMAPLPHATGRCAEGHDDSLLPVESSRWGWRAFAGSGTLLTTADDLLTFLSAAMGLIRTPLSPAFDLMLHDLRRTDATYVPGVAMPGNRIGLGWMVHRDGRGDLVWHSGGVNGFRAFIGYAPAERTEVVVLSNTSARPFGIDDIGFHLLHEGRPLAPMRDEVPVGRDQLASWWGAMRRRVAGILRSPGRATGSCCRDRPGDRRGYSRKGPTPGS